RLPPGDEELPDEPRESARLFYERVVPAPLEHLEARVRDRQGQLLGERGRCDPVMPADDDHGRSADARQLWAQVVTVERAQDPAARLDIEPQGIRDEVDPLRRGPVEVQGLDRPPEPAEGRRICDRLIPQRAQRPQYRGRRAAARGLARDRPELGAGSGIHEDEVRDEARMPQREVQADESAVGMTEDADRAETQLADEPRRIVGEDFEQRLPWDRPGGAPMAAVVV